MSLFAASIAVLAFAVNDVGTSWLTPRDGAFGDPASWSTGVPNSNTWAKFGAVPGGPFTVSITGAEACSALLIRSQACIFEGSVAGASLTARSIDIHGSGVAALTVRNCTLTSLNAMGVGTWDETGAFTLGDGATLTIGNAFGADQGSLIELAAHSAATVAYLHGYGTVRWIIDGTSACFVDVQSYIQFEGTMRIAFGPDGPPPPGSVVPLAGNPEGCESIIGDVVFETNGQIVDGVVAFEDEVLVYRQLSEPLQLTLEAPPIPSAGFESFITVTGIGDGHVYELSRQATLSSSDPAVVQVVGPDRILALAPGRATLTATLGSSSTSVDLTIGDEPLRFAPADDSSCEGTWLEGISRDGRIVAFASPTETLVRDDTNGRVDVFVRDCDSGAVDRVSEGSNGEQGSDDSYGSALSGDGRFVAFHTDAPEIVGVADVLVLKDRITRAADFVAIKPDGTPDLARAGDPFISYDGRFVAFSSESNDLVPGLSGSTLRAFVRDRLTGATTLVGIDPSGSPLPYSSPRAMSSDGRFVALFAYTQFGSALMVRDLVEGTTTVEFSLPQLVAEESHAVLSDDGRTLAFALGGSDWYGIEIVARDRVAQTTTSIASELDTFEPYVAMSANGRYVAYESTRWMPCVAGYQYGTDVWRYDVVLGTKTRVNERVGAPPLGYAQGGVALNADGRFCAFRGDFNDLMPFDQPCVSILRRRFGPINGADINGDGAVNASDLALLISAWGTSDESADLDGDGIVGPADVTTLLAAWTP